MTWLGSSWGNLGAKVWKEQLTAGKHLGDGIVYASRAPPRPGQRPEATFLKGPLKIRFFGLKTLGKFGEFLGDHFARVESYGDQI